MEPLCCSKGTLQRWEQTLENTELSGIVGNSPGTARICQIQACFPGFVGLVASSTPCTLPEDESSGSSHVSSYPGCWRTSIQALECLWYALWELLWVSSKPWNPEIVSADSWCWLAPEITITHWSYLEAPSAFFCFRPVTKSPYLLEWLTLCEIMIRTSMYTVLELWPLILCSSDSQVYFCKTQERANMHSSGLDSHLPMWSPQITCPCGTRASSH